jgi:predicted metal-dependent hydrolase
MSREQLRALAERAVEEIPKRVAHYAALMGVTYGRITIRNQKTRWGSCSSKGNLNFNCLLMLAPEQVMDYVVVHELSHRIYMNHSAAFWKTVEAYMPEYAQWRKWLKDNGTSLMAQLT